MKLLLLGATGATGALLLDLALADGHQVTALARSPEKITAQSSSLRVIPGSPTRPSDVLAAMRGTEAVISTLGARKGTVITDATAAILDAARDTGVTRVVVMSSFAVQRGQLTGAARLMTALGMGAAIADKTKAEASLRASMLDWTIVCPAKLTNGPRTGTVLVAPPSARVGLRAAISRADVAAWLLEVTRKGSYVRQDVIITS